MAGTVDWYYHRRNCDTCEKADAFLTSFGARVRERCDARAVRPDAAAALAIVRKGRRVLAVRGAKVLAFDLRDGVDESALKKAILGPYGNLRAPTMRVGDMVVVGFAEAAYREALGGGPAGRS